VEGEPVADLQSKPLDNPDETRPIEKGTVEVVHLPSGSVMRTTFQPGWRWSECVKPVAGTDSCQTHHFGYCISGRLHVVMDDGSELDIEPGSAVDIPPGHDGWVVGDEPYVGIDITGAETYARG
jgi:mannose-6-phosphate isomerase-like protein (cupin superfamily)